MVSYRSTLVPVSNELNTLIRELSEEEDELTKRISLIQEKNDAIELEENNEDEEDYWWNRSEYPVYTEHKEANDDLEGGDLEDSDLEDSDLEDIEDDGASGGETVDEEKRTFKGAEVLNERLVYQATKALEYTLGWLEDVYENAKDIKFLDPKIKIFWEKFKEHKKQHGIQFAKNPRPASVAKWNDDPLSKQDERDLPIATGKVAADPKQIEGMMQVMINVLDRKCNTTEKVQAGVLVGGLDRHNRTIGGNFGGDGATVMTWNNVLKRLKRIGTFHDSQSVRRLSFGMLADANRFAVRAGGFHQGMGGYEAGYRIFAKKIAPFLHVNKRGDRFETNAVSRSYQKHKWYFHRIYLSRMSAHFLWLMENELFPSLEALFPNGTLDVNIFKSKVLDTMLGQEDEQSDMFHYWGTQLFTIGGLLMEYLECIKDRDAETNDILTYIFLLLDLQLGKTNYQHIHAAHIMLSKLDNKARMHCERKKRYKKIESTGGGHAVATDHILENAVGELKPILNNNGLATATTMAKSIFLTTIIGRLMKDAGNSGTSKPVRHSKQAKCYDQMTEMIGLLMRSDIIDCSTKTNERELENETLHRIAHHQGVVGKAREYEGKKVQFTEAMLTQSGLTGEAREMFVVRAVAGPEDSATLMWATVVENDANENED